MNNIDNLLLAIDGHDLLLWILIAFVVVFLAVIITLLSIFLRKKNKVNEEPGDTIIIKREEVVEEVIKEVPEEKPEVASVDSRKRRK